MVLVAAACGGSADQPTPNRIAPVLDACPTGRGTPITGVRTTMLPCLSSPHRQVSAAAVHGQPQVINFWASWCKPCRREARLLEAAHRAAGDRVLFLGVDSRDTRSAALSFLASSNVTYPQVSDETGIFAARIGLQGIPDTLVVNASGHIVYRWFGELTRERLRDGLAGIGEAAVAR
jgi:thiol-disulfide isomerase/thioredoxin